MVIADIPYECFRSVSAQDSKFNEEGCLKKWNNLVSSYGDEPKDINQLMFFMRKIGILVQMTPSSSTSCQVFDFSCFYKGILIDYDDDPPQVKPEYTSYTLSVLNRFFDVVALTKMEIFQVRYDSNNNVVEVVQRFSNNSFFDAFQPSSVFIKYWLCSVYRRQYGRYVFEPEAKSTTRSGV